MDLSASRREAPVLEFAEAIGSTNAALAERARTNAALPDRAVVATLDQTAGRGRLDRAWTAPPGTSLAVSVWLRAEDPVGRPIHPDRLGWVGLAAGVAAAETVTEEVPHASVALKWPNDVLVGGKKLCGVLAQAVVVDGVVSGVVVGLGLNLTIPPDRLPVPTATSLTLEGADESGIVDRVLSTLLRRLGSHVGALRTARGDADASGLRDRARELCGTLGRRVLVELPGSEIVGTAVDLDREGRLVVATEDGPVAVAVGDVTHLRHG